MGNAETSRSEGGQNSGLQLAGWIEDGAHVLPIRVYFEDTDFSGIVYHASYVRWFERGRSDFLRVLGIHHSDLIAPGERSEPAAFVVRRLEVDYLRPARIDQVIEVRTRCEELGSAALWLEQQVMRDGQQLGRGRVQVVLVSQSGKPQRLTGLIHNAFKSFDAKAT